MSIMPSNAQAKLLIRCAVDGWVLDEPLSELFPATFTSAANAAKAIETETNISHVSILDLKKRISILRGGVPVSGLRLLYKGYKLSDTKTLNSLLQEHVSDTAGAEPTPVVLYLLDNSHLGNAPSPALAPGPHGFVASPGDMFHKPQSHLYNSHPALYHPSPPYSITPAHAHAPATAALAMIRPDERSLAAAAAWLGSDQAVLAPSGRDCDEHYLLVATSLLHLSQAQRRNNAALSIRAASPVSLPEGLAPAPAPAAAAAPVAPAAVARLEPAPEQRWIHITLLLRFTLAVIILGFDAPLTMQAVYALIGILYYIHEVRKMRDNAARAAAAAALAAAQAAGAPLPVPVVPALPAPPQGRISRIISYWENIYNEGFPVPQSPGMFLDLFSLVMGLFASLYPHWDPRPVTPIVRAQVPAIQPPAPAGADGADAGADGAAEPAQPPVRARPPRA